jgi:hypothetical protein
MRCAKCARDNPEDAKFCVGCGNPFGGRCAKCGAENPADASFCKQCGTRLGGVATPSAAAARSERISVRSEQTDGAALDGERKTVTALFADIKGSMDLIEDLDPEEAKAIEIAKGQSAKWGSCARQLISRDCCKTAIAAMRRAQSSPTSTTGSPREGFGTADLKDAKALLCELSS